MLSGACLYAAPQFSMSSEFGLYLIVVSGMGGDTAFNRAKRCFDRILPRFEQIQWNGISVIGFEQFFRLRSSLSFSSSSSHCFASNAPSALSISAVIHASNSILASGLSEILSYNRSTNCSTSLIRMDFCLQSVTFA